MMPKLAAPKGRQEGTKGRKRKRRAEEVRPQGNLGHTRATPEGGGGGLPALKGGDPLHDPCPEGC